MTNIAITVREISKRYRLGASRHDTLRDRIAFGVGSLLRKNRNDGRPPGELWALRDVSFDIQRGEVMGIIGPNGAGKSTLLKILSRITEPTTGRVEIYGRVGSLLEVGAGFHPELSGRENIYFNGAILGMTGEEIDRKFDEIVDFAEIEQFLETPVKHYSSGMYVRLAFAVAAHLEPEILLVDEVLAVGDTAFQRKCLGKMNAVATEGRTVLFVSHNMAAIQTLCSRGVVLQRGVVAVDDEVSNAVTAYLRSLEDTASHSLADRKDRPGRGRVRLTKVEIFGGNDHSSTMLASGQPAYFVFHLSDIIKGLECTFTIYDHHGKPVVNFNSAILGPRDRSEPEIGAKSICEVEELLLVPGRYRINVAISGNGQLEDHVEAAVIFDVLEGQLRGRPIAVGPRFGSVCMDHSWRTPA